MQKLREVVEKLSDEDLNFLAENLTGQDLIDFTHGKNLIKLAKLLIKRPGLIKLAKNLL